MSALDNLAQWDDRRYTFYLGKFHGRWVLKRVDRNPKRKPETFHPWCEKHFSWTCGALKPVSGIEALTWAKKNSEQRDRRKARKDAA